MVKKYKWIKSRKIIIFSIIIDFLILIFMVHNIFSQKINNYVLNLKIFESFFILFAWVFISYIFNRYYSFNLKKIKKIGERLFTTLISFLLSYSVFIILFEILINKFGFNKDLYSVLITFPFISGIINFILNISGEKYISNRENWLYVGEPKNFENLKKISKNDCIRKIKLSYYKQEKNEVPLKKNFKGIIIDSVDKNHKIKVNNLIKENIQIINLINWCEMYMNRIPTEIIKNRFIVNESNFKENYLEERIKRIGDIIISLILLISTLPIIIIIGILIKLEDGGPLLYLQERIGKNYSIFTIYKIRSMKINSEKDGVKWSSIDDPRITKIGKFIRKTRLDEIPQLLSVIKGDMSLIGPRPERPEFYELLQEYIPNFAIRSRVKPGLSGWAQVNYPYGSSIEDSRNKLSYDIYYIRNFSIFLDFLILIKTIKIVLQANGR